MIAVTTTSAIEGYQVVTELLTAVNDGRFSPEGTVKPKAIRKLVSSSPRGVAEKMADPST